MSLNGDVGGSAPVADTPVETEVETSAPSDSSPEVSSSGESGDGGELRVVLRHLQRESHHRLLQS